MYISSWTRETKISLFLLGGGGEEGYKVQNMALCGTHYIMGGK